MTSIPDAAIAVIAAAYDDYRLTTPARIQTPRGAAERAAERAAEYLMSFGWGLHIPLQGQPQPPARERARCPHCTARHQVTQAGRIRRHGPHGHPCPGSGAPAPALPAA